MTTKLPPIFATTPPVQPESASIPGVSEGVGRDGTKVALLFAGLGGSDWAGVVHELYDGFPVFAETLDAVCDCFDALLDRPQREVLFAPPGSPDAAALLDDIVSCQTGLFAGE